MSEHVVTEDLPKTRLPRRGLVETASLLLVVVIAALLFLARYDDPRRLAPGDSFWYMRQALIFTGVDAVAVGDLIAAVAVKVSPVACARVAADSRSTNPGARRASRRVCV
jgi:hypothetical protein